MPFAITVDLASFSPTRGEEAKDSPNKIHLPPKLLRVSFLLPIGMEPGEYALRLKDSAGIVLKEVHLLGRLNNGVTSVEVDLDFSTTSRGSLSLMIRPPGLSWRTFPVLVELGNEYDLWTAYEKTESTRGERRLHVAIAERIQYNVAIAAFNRALDCL